MYNIDRSIHVCMHSLYYIMYKYIYIYNVYIYMYIIPVKLIIYTYVLYEAIQKTSITAIS